MGNDKIANYIEDKFYNEIYAAVEAEYQNQASILDMHTFKVPYPESAWLKQVVVTNVHFKDDLYSVFRDKFARAKGFCLKHYGELHRLAPKSLSAKYLDEFVSVMSRLTVENFKRVRDELEWFTDKFDYRNADADWKNSKDALIRAIQKTNGIFVEEAKKK